MDIKLQIVLLILVLLILCIFIYKHFHRIGSNEIDFINDGQEMIMKGGKTTMSTFNDNDFDVPKFISAMDRYFMEGKDDEIIKEYTQNTESSIRSMTSNLIRACESAVRPIKNIVDEHRMIRNALAEVFVFIALKTNLEITSVNYLGTGSFNYVFHLNALDVVTDTKYDFVLRLRNENFARLRKAHREALELMQNVKTIFDGKNYIVIPHYSSLDLQHEYNDAELENYAFIWSIGPLLQPIPDVLTLKEVREYITLIYEVILLAHRNGLVYLDWKFDNVMMMDGKFLISDIDFINVRKQISGAPSTHSYSNKFHDELNALKSRMFMGADEDLKWVDKHIAIREMLVSLMVLANEFTTSSQAVKDFIKTDWFNETCHMQNKAFEDFINSLIPMLQNNSMIVQEELDFVYKYINEFLDILEDGTLSHDEVEQRTLGLIENHAEDIRYFSVDMFQRNYSPTKRQPTIPANSFFDPIEEMEALDFN